MLFNSLDFAVFFPIIFILYWFVFNKSVKVQNIFLLAASYFFYACWDWRFVFLIASVTLANFYFAKAIAAYEGKKSRYVLACIIIINLMVLGFFKYFNFFVENFAVAFRLFGSEINVSSYSIILPLGISFYIFQNISYVTDVYRKHSEPSQNLWSFSLFVAFFPMLVSGPIERKNHLMPQIDRQRMFDYSRASDGIRMILLGLFEKIVIADYCGVIVQQIYSDYQTHTGSTLFFNAVLYSFQIYGDFSGYSHIAIGCAALLGFSLRDNFNYPYLAKNIADFWRRWHISFSSWLRDYVYFPLGGSKKGGLIQARNLIVVFVVSGIWHGANWTFVIYGFIHAALYILYVYYKKWIKPYKIFSSHRFAFLGNFCGIVGTFTVLTLARVFFKSVSVEQAFDYLARIFTPSLFSKPNISRFLVLLLIGFIALEYLQRHKRHLLDLSAIRWLPVRYMVYLTMLFMVFYYSGTSQTFIYFRF